MSTIDYNILFLYKYIMDDLQNDQFDLYIVELYVKLEDPLYILQSIIDYQKYI